MLYIPCAGTAARAARGAARGAGAGRARRAAWAPAPAAAAPSPPPPACPSLRPLHTHTHKHTMLHRHYSSIFLVACLACASESRLCYDWLDLAEHEFFHRATSI